MGRLKGLPSFAVVFREDKPPEEGDRGGLRLLETHPPSSATLATRRRCGTIKIRYARYLSDRRCIQVFFHRHIHVYPPPTLFVSHDTIGEFVSPFQTRTLITLKTHKLPRLCTCANSTTTYARVGCTSAEFREQVDDVPTGETSAVRTTTVPLVSLRRKIGSDQTLLNAVACPKKAKEKRGLGKEQWRLHDYHHCETRRRTRSYADRVHVLGSTRARLRGSGTLLHCEEKEEGAVPFDVQMQYDCEYESCCCCCCRCCCCAEDIFVLRRCLFRCIT